MGKNAPTYGKKFTEEHKRKISEGQKGRTQSEETKNKIGKANSEKISGKIWIKNESTGETKRINKEDSIPEGWERGRIVNWSSNKVKN